MTQLSQKKNSWIVSSFDSFLPDKTKGSDEGLKNRQKSTLVNAKPKANDRFPIKSSLEILWVEKHQPQEQKELAVHKGKIVEIKTWLEEQLSASKCSRMLLLTGPTGAGKTATLRYLAENMKFEIQEWTNKPGLALLYEQTMYSESQIATFQNFLFRASKYSSSQIFGQTHPLKKVILIEEFPTAILRDVTDFHNILRKYSQVGCCPIVFIVTDSSKEAKNERNLFPKDFQQELNITNIPFNPVAPSKLLSSILRVAEAEGISVPKHTTDLLVDSSQGDIRAAINALQFTFHQNSVPKMKQRPIKRSRRVKDKSESEKPPSDNSTTLFGARDESLFLFHALGKILHCKRDWERPVTHRLRPEMQDLERPTLLIDPEEIWSKTAISANNICAFLHQNYLPFTPDIENVVAATNYFSQADCLNCEWMGDSPLNEYIYSIAARGVVFGMKEKYKIGWKPLHKPSSFAVDKKYRESTKSGREIFQENYFHLAKEELFSQLIPYLTITGLSGLTKEQQLFANSIGKITLTGKDRSRNKVELLDERYILEDNVPDVESSHNLRVSSEVSFDKTTSIILPTSEDEEIIIEEFND